MFSFPYDAAVIQMNSQTDLDANLDQAHEFIGEAVEDGADLVGLPENFAFLGGLSMRIQNAAEIQSRVSDFLSDTAKEFQVYIVGGSYPVPAGDDKVYNHATLIGPDGEELASYNKIHLFDVDLSDKEAYRESDYIQPGEAEPVVYKDETIGNWGFRFVMICAFRNCIESLQSRKLKFFLCLPLLPILQDKSTGKRC